MRNIQSYPNVLGLFFTFLLLFFVFSPLTLAQSQGINLNGVWKSSLGSTVTVSQSGGVIKGTIKESKVSSRVGTSDMRGSFEGGSFKGEVYLLAENRSCSFLDGFYSATGIVSPDGNTITFTYENHIYNDETCNFTGEVRQGTLTYTKIIPQDTVTPSPTVVPTITTPPINASSGGNSTVERKIPGYAQAFVDKLPQSSDFREVPRSDFIKVYPSATVSAVTKSATSSANSKDTVFVGKVGGEGEVVIGHPDGQTTVLTSDKSAYEGGMSSLSWRFEDAYVPPQERPYVKIVEVDCHLTVANNNRGQSAVEPTTAFRERYSPIWDAQTTSYITVGDCAYLEEAGSSRVLVEKGQVTFKTPGDVVVVAGKADFGISYDATSDTSIVEIYNGEAKVSNKSGQAKKISTVYGSKIKRIEVDKNGTMTEKIAIPQSQWEAFLASQQKKDEANGNILSILGAIAVLSAGGIVLFLYRKGKLIPLYKTLGQKASGLFRKTNSKNPEKGEN